MKLPTFIRRNWIERKAAVLMSALALVGLASFATIAVFLNQALGNIARERENLAATHRGTEELFTALNQFLEVERETYAFISAGARHDQASTKATRASYLRLRKAADAVRFIDATPLRRNAQEVVRMLDRCSIWSRDVEDSNSERARMYALVADRLREFRASVTSLVGRQRLELAKKLRAFEGAGSAGTVEQAQAAIASVRGKRDAGEILEELNSIAQIVEKMNNAAGPDTLADYKDNLLSQSFSRMEMESARSLDPEFKSVSRQQINALSSAIFGCDFALDQAHQVVVKGNGFYQTTHRRLVLHDLGFSLCGEVTRLNAASNEIRRQIEEQIASYNEGEIRRTRQSLSGVWVQFLAPGAAVTALFLALCWVVASLVCRRSERTPADSQARPAAPLQGCEAAALPGQPS